MTYGDIYSALGLMFPKVREGVTDYRPQGNHSIHLWLKDGREMVFTYFHRRRWLLETYEHYKDRMAAAEPDKDSWLMERFIRVD